jgi:hypothetical protein
VQGEASAGAGASPAYFDVGKRPLWRHLLIRDDPTGAFEPGMPAGRLRDGIYGGD